MNVPAGMSRRVPGEQYRRNARQHFARIHDAHALAIGASGTLSLGPVALDALVGTFARIVIEPEVCLLLVDDQLGIGENSLTGSINETQRMVRMNVGE